MFIQYPDGIEPFTVVCNVSVDHLFSNVKASTARGLPEVTVQPANDRPAIIVGGGPSLEGTLERIKEIKADGGVIFALNNAAKYLSDRGIRADFQIVLDARKENAEFVAGGWADHCLLASQCHKDVFDACTVPVSIWHPIIDGIDEVLPHKPVLIGGGTTVGLTGMCLVYTLGHRIMHLFGYDSSYQDESSHAYPQDLNKNQETLTIAVNNRRFRASVAMSAQAQKFPHLAVELAELGCEIYPHGDGLLQYVVQTMQAKAAQKVLTAVYDLASSPPTYDFIMFLGEAEKARITGEYTHLDVIFQPGPMFGFRDDQLPPSVAEREAMLHRICVSACRLLPSVRNVEVLKERRTVEGAVFPANWTEDFPASHYGTKYGKSAVRCLRASESARKEVEKTFGGGKYVSITLRESDYWPERNSNVQEWERVEGWLSLYGYKVIWLPDTNKPRKFGYLPAMHDLDLRIAVYEKCEVNLMVANGPIALCLYSDCKYLMFKPVTESCKSTSAAFLKANGMDTGDQYGPNGRVVWADDDAETVISSVSDFLQISTT